MKGSGIGTELKRVQKRDGNINSAALHSWSAAASAASAVSDGATCGPHHLRLLPDQFHLQYIPPRDQGRRSWHFPAREPHRPQGCSSMAKEEQCGTNESFWKAALYAASPAVGEVLSPTADDPELASPILAFVSREHLVGHQVSEDTIARCEGPEGGGQTSACPVVTSRLLPFPWRIRIFARTITLTHFHARSALTERKGVLQCCNLST